MSSTDPDWPRRDGPGTGVIEEIEGRAREDGIGLSRREFVAAGLGAFAVAALAPGLVGSRRNSIVRRKIPVMGTVAEIAVVPRGGRAETRVEARITEVPMTSVKECRPSATSAGLPPRIPTATL